MGGIIGTSGRSRRSDGASLVEFALILPVFAMLLYGMISAGLALNEKQQMTHATREGARYAATVAASQAFAPAACNGANPCSWAIAVRELVVARSVGTLESADICVSLVEGATATVVSPAASFTTDPSGQPCIPGETYPTTANDTGRRVQVAAAKPAEIELIVFGSLQVTMNADATAKSESNT